MNNLRRILLFPVTIGFLLSPATALASTPNKAPLNLETMYQSIQDACAKKMKADEFIKTICRKQYHLKHKKCHYKSIKGCEVVASERLYPFDNGNWSVMNNEPFVPGARMTDFKGPDTVIQNEWVACSVLKGRIMDPHTATSPPFPVFFAFLPTRIIVIVPDKHTYDYLSRHPKVRRHRAN